VTYRDHVEDEGVKDLFEYDETVIYDPEALYLGRIWRMEDKVPVELEALPREYAQFKHLFRPEGLEKMPRDGHSIIRLTLRHGLNLLGDPFTLCHNTS